MKTLEISVADLSLMTSHLTADERDRITYDGTHLRAPEAIINKLSSLDMNAVKKSDLAAYAAARRYTIETGGIMVGSMEVSTDRQTQQMINGAFNMAQQNAEFTTMWKGSSGSFVELNAETIIAIAQAIGAHVAACFASEAAAVAKINAGVYTTRDHIDAAIVI